MTKDFIQEELEKEIKEIKEQYNNKPMRMGQDMKNRLLLIEKEAKLSQHKISFQAGKDACEDIKANQLADHYQAGVRETKQAMIKEFKQILDSYDDETSEIIKRRT